MQFQNNGAPSRQQYGGNISCNGSTMTFSPFYMGNHTKPWEVEEDTGAVLFDKFEANEESDIEDEEPDVEEFNKMSEYLNNQK